MVLNSVAPRLPSTMRVNQLARTRCQLRLSSAAVNGSKISRATPQRQKPIATGGISLRIARPTTQLPAQKREARVSRRYGERHQRGRVDCCFFIDGKIPCAVLSTRCCVLRAECCEAVSRKAE